MNRSLLPLAGLYGLGAQLRRRAFERGWLKSRRLSRPVISVGNLTVGGSGKTPLVALIAEILLRHGYKPAILTRGYRRERAAGLIALEPHLQTAPDARRVGDEPALLAKVNAALVAMDKAGEIDRLWAKWLGPNTEYKMVREEKVMPLSELKFELLP